MRAVGVRIGVKTTRYWIHTRWINQWFVSGPATRETMFSDDDVFRFQKRKGILSKNISNKIKAFVFIIVSLSQAEKENIGFPKYLTLEGILRYPYDY